jgi:hypothetical protein
LMWGGGDVLGRAKHKDNNGDEGAVCLKKFR